MYPIFINVYIYKTFIQSCPSDIKKEATVQALSYEHNLLARTEVTLWILTMPKTLMATEPIPIYDLQYVLNLRTLWFWVDSDSHNFLNLRTLWFWVYSDLHNFVNLWTLWFCKEFFCCFADVLTCERFPTRYLLKRCCPEIQWRCPWTLYASTR